MAINPTDTNNTGAPVNDQQLEAADDGLVTRVATLESEVDALQANFPVTVPNGGTGATTLTDNGVLFGNATAAIGAVAAMTTGQTIVGVTGQPPVAGNLSNLAGSIPLAGLPAGVARPLSGTILAAAVGAGATINVALPANSIIHAVRVKTTTAFSGAGVAAASVDVGITGVLDGFIDDYDILAAVSDTNLALNNGTATTGAVGIWGQATVAAYNVIFTFTADAAVTAGVLAYDIFYTPMS